MKSHGEQDGLYSDTSAVSVLSSGDVPSEGSQDAPFMLVVRYALTVSRGERSGREAVDAANGGQWPPRRGEELPLALTQRAAGPR